MRHGFRKPVDHTRRKDAVEIFRIPVRVLSRFYATIDCADRCIPTHFAARVKQGCNDRCGRGEFPRSEEHTSELQSLMRISYAVFCLKKKKSQNTRYKHTI